MWKRLWMNLPMILSMLSTPPHCHRVLRLRCSKVPGSDSAVCLLEKLIIILLSQHNTISNFKIKCNFFIKRSLSPDDK